MFYRALFSVLCFSSYMWMIFPVLLSTQKYLPGVPKKVSAFDQQQNKILLLNFHTFPVLNKVYTKIVQIRWKLS